MRNADIAAVFDEIADLLEILGENPFRVRAYRNAARTVQGLGRETKNLIDRGENLTDLPGIGADLAGKIKELVESGECRLRVDLHRRLPASVALLLKIPGLGPKRVKLLHDELHVETVEQLERAAREGRVRELRGLGEKTETQILDALSKHLGALGRFRISDAAAFADALEAQLRTTPGIGRVVVAGSYRRARETVGDLNLLVTAAQSEAVMQRVTDFQDVEQVLSRGPTRSSVRLQSALQVDVRVVPEESFGAALHYFTGSKAHNIAIRQLGQQAGIKINEYGVFRGRRRVAGETEASVYAAVGLPYIAPELRENRGEIEAARSGRLPMLVAREDLQGDLHAHTHATDGRNSLEEMALAARAAGLRYLAITEHSRRLTIVNGLDAERLRRQLDEIAQLNDRLEGITLLRGIEVDILEDGDLDLPDSVLRELDLVVASVHSAFNLSRTRQTERLLRAMDHPHFTILGHPTGRVIGEREAYDVDLLRVMRHARQRGCFLELNASPERLDLTDTYCRMAKDEGVLVAISSDAHGVRDFADLHFGIGQARRGWLEKHDVLNTRDLDALWPLLHRTMSRAA